MTVTTLDGLVNAIGNNADKFVIDKSSLANFAAGIYGSLWRATGQPGQGAIPNTTPTICIATTVGGITLTQQTAPTKSYLTNLDAVSGNAGTSIEIHDRLVNVGGLSGNTTAVQTITGFDLSTLHSGNTAANLNDRKGASDYSDVQWWVEWYADTGATAANVTANAIFNDGTSANLSLLVLPATRRLGMVYPLNNLIQAAQSGKYIRGINSITFTNSAAQGNVGITCTRYKGSVYTPIANARFPQDWQQLGLNEFYPNSCPHIIVLTTTTSTGTLRATGKVSHG
jgi:hypothetical protein